MAYRQRHVIYTASGPPPPPPPGHEGQDPNTSVVDLAFCPSLWRSAMSMMAERVMGAAQRRRERLAPSIPPARTVDGANGAGDGPPPQRPASGGAERGGGARGVRWPTGTEDSSTGDAASQPGRAALPPSPLSPSLPPPPPSPPSPSPHTHTHPRRRRERRLRSR